MRGRSGGAGGGGVTTGGGGGATGGGGGGGGGGTVTPVCDPRAKPVFPLLDRVEASAIGIVCMPARSGRASVPGVFRTSTVNVIWQVAPGVGSTTCPALAGT